MDGSTLLNSTINNLLTFTVFFIIILQFYGNGFRKWGKKLKGKLDDSEWTGLPGIEAIPGPKHWDPTGLIGSILEFLPFEKAFSKILIIAKKYGDVFKFTSLNQYWVVLNSGAAIQSLCKSSDMGHLKKSPDIYDRLKPFVTNGVLVSTGKFWQHERKLLLKSQTYQSLKAYIPLLNKHSKLLAASLEELFKDGKSHEINWLINSLFIKVISEMLTGFDNEQSDEYTQYHHNFKIWKESFINRVLKPWLLFPPFWKLHPLSRKHDKAVGEMFEFAKKRIKEHKEKRAVLEARQNGSWGTTSGKTTFRSVLDDLVDGGVDERQMVDEINTMLFGGHETGASAIHCFFFCMALNPEIQKECQKEVDELFDDPLSYVDGSVTFDAVSSNLKLVERCILETLRLFPPVFLFSRKLESPLKIKCNGEDVVLPPGTNAVVLPYLLHRTPEHFPEPEKFDPDRFLPEECAKRDAYTFLPFSAGPRNCLGFKFAMIEMKIIVAYTLRHFFMTTTDKMEDIPLLPYLTITPAKDYTFQFTKREVNMAPSSTRIYKATKTFSADSSPLLYDKDSK